MSMILRISKKQTIEYPTSDGRPMAETDIHRVLIVALIQMLETWFARSPLTYVTGNLLLFYVKKNLRKHVAPDVMVIKGAPKRRRLHYKLWEERCAPSVVIEVTSRTTRTEDVDFKFTLYEQVLKVQEYFLFDPLGEYLEPSLRGYRLVRGKYVPIAAVAGRLPSKELGLHLEASGSDLQLYDPKRRVWLQTPEAEAADARAEIQSLREELARIRDQERNS
jgi:Uma2 family endonuclease